MSELKSKRESASIESIAKFNLALNVWEPAQILQPAHFLTQEEALLNTIAQTTALAGLPSYGVARLELDEGQLAVGVVHIKELTVVFGDGRLVVLGSNASLSTLTLAQVKTSPVRIYLRLLPTFKKVRETAGYHQDIPAVDRKFHDLELSLKDTVDSREKMMEIARLTKVGITDAWQLDGYVPPLLQVGVGQTKFLVKVLDQVKAAAITLYADLGRQLLEDCFSGEDMATARRCQLAAYRWLTVLADRDAGVCRHPHYFLQALRDFRLDLCLLRRQAPEEPDPAAYNHMGLEKCFNDVVGEIMDLIAPVQVAGSSSQLAFTRDDGMCSVASPFPNALLTAKEVYLVVHRPDVRRKVSFAGIKLATLARLDTVHARSLSGVDFTRIEPSFQHPFGPRVEMYKLTLDDEWKLARAARSLAYYAPSEHEGVVTSLLWSGT